MTPSARTYTGIMQIFFGGSTVSGARGQHAVDFPRGVLNKYGDEDFSDRFSGFYSL